MDVWPWCPLSPVTVAYEWNTQVLQTKEAEQRISNRTAPRIFYHYDHNLSQIESRDAWELARALGPVMVPDWTLSTPVDVLAGASRVIPLATAGAGFYVGGRAMLWNDTDDYEVGTVTAVATNSITLAVVQENRPNALLMPVYSGALPAGLSVSRGARNNDTVSATLEVYASPLRPDPGLALYQSLPVLDVCPQISQGPLNNKIQWGLDSIDNAVGIPYFQRQRNIATESFRLAWQAHSREEAGHLKDIFYLLRGKNRAFFFPTFAQDFALAISTAPGDDFIIVYANRNTTTLLAPDFHIEIVTHAGDQIRRQVVDTAAHADVNGLRAVELKLDSAVGAVLTSEETKRISALYRARLDTDRLEFDYQASASRGGSVRVAASAVNAPVYAPNSGS